MPPLGSVPPVWVPDLPRPCSWRHKPAIPEDGHEVPHVLLSLKHRMELGQHVLHLQGVFALLGVDENFCGITDTKSSGFKNHTQTCFLPVMLYINCCRMLGS